MNSKEMQTKINTLWDTYIVPELIEYIKIPNKSPQFDTHWQEHGHMARAVELMTRWAKAQPIKGLTLEVVQLQQRTPLIFMEIAGQSKETVLLYGHLDKQPEMTGWQEGYGPWQPRLEGDKLYGRGGADDGYAIFASLTAIRVLQEQGLPHARCVVIIEACEESGSYDLPYYIDHLQAKIGTPDLVICLDSGCANYEQLWMTTSLRGLVGGELRVELLTEGVHSGSASGIVADSFRVLRQLLSRVEDEKTGKILVDALHVDIPDYRVTEAKHVADILGGTVYTEFPFHKGTQPVNTDRAELLLNRTWRPALSIIGCAGLPALENAGNVSRPRTSVMLSMRIPPLCNPEKAGAALKATLEKDPPYGAKVACSIEKAARAGTHLLQKPGYQRRAITRHRRIMASQQLIWVKVERFPLWACWVKNSLKRSL
jgi:acetylornithine deacetylase/succinyl-diaminopimelate desuccinylase-like protein